MQKPGDIITPASFAVAPELLGRPLASPSRRATAMVIDLLVVAILANAGAVFFGVAAAFALWRASARTDFASRRPRLRKSLRIGAALVLFLVVVTNWGFWTRPLHRLTSAANTEADDGDETTDSAFVSVNGGHGVKLGAASAVALGGQYLGLRNARNEKEARRIADKLVQRMQKEGLQPEQIRDVASNLAGTGDGGGALSPVGAAALQQAIQQAFPADTAELSAAQTRDSLAVRYAAAITRPDTAAAGEIRPRLAAAFATDSLATLDRRAAQLKAQNQSLRKQLDSATAQARKGAGLVDTMADAGGELMNILRKAGLGFGWLGLYFTGFVAMMRGQTPGKWLMRIRIVRLDGRPMNWWASLERFGGYAASVVTALSGFFQILWDKNRQAMHDKIAETVVVRV